MTSTFAYRGDGLRDSHAVGMTTTTFTWDINAGLPVVLDDGNQYLYGAGLAAMKQSGNWYYYLADGLGSTMAIVDADGDVQNGYTYDIYGEPTVTGSLANEFDFAGQQTDATGLQYLRARYYDPETGVFLSRDPLAALPSWLGSPFGYAYADPVGLSDPTGLDSPWDGVRKRANPCNWGRLTGGACERAGKIADESGPAVDAVTLVGEYVAGKIIAFASLYGFYAQSENPDWAEVFAQLGPNIRECARDIACAALVGAILDVTAATSLVLFQPEISTPLVAAAFAWATYAAKEQFEANQRPSPVPPVSIDCGGQRVVC